MKSSSVLCQEHSWNNCCWSDDNLANKKLYPDHTFSTGSKKSWAGRLRTSSESMILAVQRAHSVHNMKPTILRRKLDNQTVENISMRATCVLSVATEFASSTPVPEEQARQEFVDLWAKGSEQIEMEVSSVLSELPEDIVSKQHVTISKKKAINTTHTFMMHACLIQDFDPCKHIPSLKNLLDLHIFQAPMGNDAGKKEQLHIDEFTLFSRQCEFDIRAFQTWRKKVSAELGSRKFREQEMKMERHNQCKQAADTFVRGCVKLTCQTQPEKLVAELIEFKRGQIAARTGSSSIPHVAGVETYRTCYVSLFHTLIPYVTHNDDDGDYDDGAHDVS